MKIKKKLKYITYEEYKNNKDFICATYRAVLCENCPLRFVDCSTSKNCWVYHKEELSNKFLNREIEIEVEHKLTDDERTILRNLNKKWLYIARDKSNKLCIYANKPIKHLCVWISREDTYSCVYLPFPDLFKFVTWEDKEPYLISDLLNEEK